jgi:hypothetical protein
VVLHFKKLLIGESGMEPSEKKIKTDFQVWCALPAHSRCFSTAEKDAVAETVCVSVLKLWQAVCTENGKPGSSLLITDGML